MARQPKRISEFDRALGKAIRHARLDPDKGLSQQTLADRAGVPVSNLQRREEGVNEVTVSELERIAVALQTTSHEIVTDALRRYGGLPKLVAEYARTSEDADNVNPDDNVHYLGHVQPPERVAAKKKPNAD